MGRARNLWASHSPGRRGPIQGRQVARRVSSHHAGKTGALQPASGQGRCRQRGGALMTRILIIEDNPQDAQMFRHLLEKEGYEVELADSAAAGLAQVQPGSFDVVLTDLYLGGAKSDEGRDLVVKLRAAYPHLPDRKSVV